jgi:DNA-binding NtrC family response regulator
MMPIISNVIRVGLYSQDQKLPPLLAPALGKEFQVITRQDGDRVKELVNDGLLDIVLLDLDAEFCNIQQQLELYNQITQSGVAVVAMTDDSCRATAIDLVQRGAHSYCRKPPALRELKAIMRRAYEHTIMKRQLAGKQMVESTQPETVGPLTCDGLIGSSAEMCNVYDLIRRVANLNASVLITGESGTGKELIARAIHNQGDRAQCPFVAVSCGAIPETLIESELFGHEKGAFTGTAGVRTGYLEQAGNGTLLLDEIGELSLQTQVKLLRVLQQKEFTRLGSGRAIPLKARVLFSTHRDLERMIAEGTFRLDLYYRLNVMTIKAPALADHSEDIPALAQFFVDRYSDLYNKRVSHVTPSALAMLQDYDWPGNVREMENVIQSALIRADTAAIQSADLPERFQQAVAADDPELAQIGSFERLLRDFKLKIAMKAIEDCKGNKTLAARSLNISRAYLHRLIRVDENVQAIDAA